MNLLCCDKFFMLRRTEINLITKMGLDKKIVDILKTFFLKKKYLN
jgi:hypothetical protein